MTALKSTRRRRTIVAFVFGVVVALCLPMLSYAAVRLIKDSKEGTCANCSLPPATPIPPTPVSMLATVDGNGEVTTITLFGLLPPQGDKPARGGTIMIVPAGAQTFLADGSAARVGDAYGTGDAEALKTAVEGLLGITISEYAVLDEAGTAAVLQPFAPLQVSVPDPVVTTGANGSDTELFPAGSQRFDQRQMAQFLTAHQATQSELQRLPRIEAFWNAVRKKIGAGLTVAAPTTTAGEAATTETPSTKAASGSSSSAGAGSSSSGPASSGGTPAPVKSPGFDSFMQSFIGGTTYVYRFGATRSDNASLNPKGDDRLLLDPAEVIFVMAKTVPAAVSPTQNSISFWVRSSLGEAATKDAVSRLAFAGANVLLVTESNDPAPAITTIEYIDKADRSDAESLARQLGAFTTVDPTLRVEGINVILTLGKNYVTGGSGPTPTSGPGTAGSTGSTRPATAATTGTTATSTTGTGQ